MPRRWRRSCSICGQVRAAIGPWRVGDWAGDWAGEAGGHLHTPNQGPPPARPGSQPLLRGDDHTLFLIGSRVPPTLHPPCRRAACAAGGGPKGGAAPPQARWVALPAGLLAPAPMRTTGPRLQQTPCCCRRRICAAAAAPRRLLLVPPLLSLPQANCCRGSASACCWTLAPRFWSSHSWRGRGCMVRRRERPGGLGLRAEAHGGQGAVVSERVEWSGVQWGGVGEGGHRWLWSGAADARLAPPLRPQPLLTLALC